MTTSNPIQILINESVKNREMVNIDIIKSPMKYEILNLLRQNEMNFDEIVKSTSKSKAVVSLHLKDLREEGIVGYKADPSDNRKKIFFPNSKMLGFD
ncbi:transcriptional regulator [Methanobrevibacter sp.]|uniref:helix-turn-helix domain-containing protein n=1 Tax=Methanobrevibacter sp. TaxID=66852 RepID=UPI0026E00271|nr:transcriptional regulator [Methanobrevibacter sp.]MDO5859669.1 transcriptional regulator [Methanobrevibacter sp.]